jgi:hypothetical protein
MCFRLISSARSINCLLVHVFLLVLRFACRFKVVLGTQEQQQIRAGVIVAKVQCPFGRRSRAPQRQILPISIYPLISSKVRNKP